MTPTAIAARLVALPILRGLRAPELAAELGADQGAASSGIGLAFGALTGHAPPRDPGSDLSIDDLLVLLGRPAFVEHANNGAPMANARTVFVLSPFVLEHALAMRPDLARAEWARYWRAANGVGVAKGPPPAMAAGPLAIRIEHGAGDLFGDLFGSGGGADEVVTAVEDTLPDEPGMTGIDPSYMGTGGGGGGGAMAKNKSKPLGTPGLYRSAPDYQWTFAIMSGWSPRAYAAAVTGDENRARELIDLNAPTYGTTGTPGTLGYNLKRFVIGEPLKIPKGWNDYISQEGDWGTKGAAWPAAPAATETIPTPPAPTGSTTGTSYTASLPDGTIAAVKTQLGALGVKYPAIGITPAGWPGLYDLNDAVDELFHENVLRFQAWSNANRGLLDSASGSTGMASPIRTDGVFDEPTHAMLNRWTAYSAGTGTTPVAVTKDSIPTDPFKPSWPTATTDPGPTGPGKELLPGSLPAAGGGTGSGMTGTASNTGGGGAGAGLAALVVAYLASKAL